MRRVISKLVAAGRGRKIYCPGLLLIFMLTASVSMAKSLQQSQQADTIPPKFFTVANIVIPREHKEYYLVTFNESAQFYKLYRKNKNCKKAAALLKQSKKSNQPVRVYLTQNMGDIIEDVRKK